MPDWINSHQQAFQFFGGVTELMVLDNLEFEMSKVYRCKPDINPTYQEMTAHYGTTILPARVQKPRDKAKAEVGVQWVHKIGEITAKLAEGIMSRRAYPQQDFRACLCLVTLAKKYGEARVEVACLRVLAYGSFSSKSVERIIDKELDKASVLTPASESSPILHPNIRGVGYFLTAQGGSHAD
ncbi:hypothetical protein DFAR_2210033 [Desulfarculales bacterium]